MAAAYGTNLNCRNFCPVLLYRTIMSLIFNVLTSKTPNEFRKLARTESWVLYALYLRSGDKVFATLAVKRSRMSFSKNPLRNLAKNFVALDAQ